MVGRCRIIAVNLSFRLIEGGADVLYGADCGFWARYPDARAFPGLKLSPGATAQRHCPSLHLVEIPKVAHRSVEDLVRGPVGTIGSGGGNGGFQALNLAIQFGADPIFLVGLDFCGSHWHPDHDRGLANPTPVQLRRWRERLDRQAATLRDWGVRVINLSRSSALRAFPHDDADRILPPPG